MGWAKGPSGRGTQVVCSPASGPGGWGARLTGHLLSCGGHGATWPQGSSSGFLKDRHGGEGWGVGSSVTQPPDLSLRLRPQQLPLPQDLAEDDGDAFIYISPAGAKRAQANTLGRNPWRERAGLPSGPAEG